MVMRRLRFALSMTALAATLATSVVATPANADDDCASRGVALVSDKEKQCARTAGTARVAMLPAQHRGFGRHRFACPSELLAANGWRRDGPNKPYLPALAVCLGVAIFSSAALAEQPIPSGLSSGPDINTQARFQIWRTTTLGSYKGVDAYRDALDAANIKIGDAANEILGRPAFPYVTAKTKVELTVVSAAELGVESELPLADVYNRARQVGLVLCPPEVGPQLRLDYRDQPLGESLIIAMEPVKTYSGEPTILSLVNWGTGPALLGGPSDFMVTRYLRFVFALPIQIAAE
jgi:hypothetical protein